SLSLTTYDHTGTHLLDGARNSIGTDLQHPQGPAKPEDVDVCSDVPPVGPASARHARARRAPATRQRTNCAILGCPGASWPRERPMLRSPLRSRKAKRPAGSFPRGVRMLRVTLTSRPPAHRQASVDQLKASPPAARTWPWGS